MDERESPTLKNRKRTESNGGSSDSELSEGWNIIDQADVTGHDVPSSDGESVEVIDAEDESPENVTDTETGGPVMEGETQLLPAPDTSVAPVTESEVPAVSQRNAQEEMFDSSFCWFLFFATAAVLVSNVAFMVAENALAWNMDAHIEAPSFLRDLPTTPKPKDGSNFLQNIPWAEKEEVIVETVDDKSAVRIPENKYDNRLKNTVVPKEESNKYLNKKFKNHPNKKFYRPPIDNFNKHKNEKIYENPSENFQKDSFTYNHEIRRYFKSLSEITSSSETRDKLDQALLILDALYIGLNDLEDVVIENTELHAVLMKQKYKLSEILTEMEYGVSKSMERLSINILNKVQKLERRFENQWCDLERRGHQEELKGLFYDCEEIDEKVQSEHQTNSAQLEKVKGQLDATEKYKPQIDTKWNNYQYQVDKDSPGKEHFNILNNEEQEENNYYKIMKIQMQKDIHNSDNNVDTKSDQRYDEKITFYNGKYNKKRMYPDHETKHSDYKKNDEGNNLNKKEKHYDEKSYNKKKSFDDKRKTYNAKTQFPEDKMKYSKKSYKPDIPTTERSKNHKANQREEQMKREKSFARNPEPELVSKYLKENCDKNKSKFTKFSNIYEKLKHFVDSKLRVPKKMFDSLFARYCKVDDDSFDWEKRFSKEHLKGDFSGKNKNLFKEEMIIDDSLDKNVGIIDITEVRTEDKAASQGNDKVLLPDKQPRQWLFSYDESTYDNNSNVTGYWFFKAGESRSKMRWTQHRGDWWFERASHRRNHPYHPNWFTGRRKNWFFRRAWARQQCRQSPHDGWCDLSDDETITVPNYSSNFR